MVAADSDSMTVNYSCPGAGRGRTTIRFETPRLVQIDSQGLDHGAPFALARGGAAGRRLRLRGDSHVTVPFSGLIQR